MRISDWSSDVCSSDLSDVATKVKAMEARLPAFFNTLPKAPLQVKAVEAFREKSAGKAFYQSPSPAGSRPGTYYVNLYDLRDMSKTELEAPASHEGITGHHLHPAVPTRLTGPPPLSCDKRRAGKKCG